MQTDSMKQDSPSETSPRDSGFGDLTSGLSTADASLIERALRWTAGFAGWSAAGIAELVASATLKRYARGKSFVCGADNGPESLLVVSGYLVVSCVREGTDGAENLSPLEIIGPGRLMGGMNLFDTGAEDVRFHYRAMEDAVLVRLPVTQLVRLLDAQPRLWKDMARMVLKSQRASLSNLLDHLTGQLHERLAATIDQLAAQHGVPSGAGVKFRFRLTQGDLAAMLQVTRQTTNKGLAWLHQCGVISPDYNSITVLNRDELQRIAGKGQRAPAQRA